MLRHPISLALVATTLLFAMLPGADAIGPPRHYYGNGHVDVAWTSSALPPFVEGTGTGSLTTNLATFGEAIAFGMPITSFHVRVLPAAAPNPVHGTMVMTVPPATDPWWAGYGAPVPPGITTGGRVEFSLSGYAEHYPHAVTLYGTFTVTAATGQYAGLVSSGEWSGTTTGGGGSFGPFFDFAMIGQWT